MDWKPMDTAPRDGTEFAARITSRWAPAFTVERARFNPKTGLFETFVDADGERGWQPDFDDNPTHWR